MADFKGTAHKDTIDGTDGADRINVAQGGNDTVNGLGGHDRFLFGATLTGDDRIDGGTGHDAVVIDGDYSGGLAIHAGRFLNVEELQLGGGHHYSITFFNVRSDLVIDASALGDGNMLELNASARKTGSLTVAGGGGDDNLSLIAGGAVHVEGGGGDDVFTLIGDLTRPFTANGGAGHDSLILNGDDGAGIFLHGDMMRNYSSLAVLSGLGFNVTVADEEGAAGKTLQVILSGAPSGPNFFDGSQERDGRFVVTSNDGDMVVKGGHGADLIHTGSGNDQITGGRGADLLIGGNGDDVFVYGGAQQSTGADYDTIKGFDAFKTDQISLTSHVEAIDAAVTDAALSQPSFDANMTDAVAGPLHAHNAIMVTASSGGLSGETFIVVDANGVAGYQSGEDYVFHMDGMRHAGQFNAGDFI